MSGREKSPAAVALGARGGRAGTGAAKTRDREHYVQGATKSSRVRRALACLRAAGPDGLVPAAAAARLQRRWAAARPELAVAMPAEQLALAIAGDEATAAALRHLGR